MRLRKDKNTLLGVERPIQKDTYHLRHLPLPTSPLNALRKTPSHSTPIPVPRLLPSFWNLSQPPQLSQNPYLAQRRCLPRIKRSLNAPPPPPPNMPPKTLPPPHKPQYLLSWTFTLAPHPDLAHLPYFPPLSPHFYHQKESQFR